MEGGLMFLQFKNSQIRNSICGMDRARRVEVEAALRVLASAARTPITFTCVDGVHGGELLRVEKDPYPPLPKKRGRALKKEWRRGG